MSTNIDSGAIVAPAKSVSLIRGPSMARLRACLARRSSKGGLGHVEEERQATVRAGRDDVQALALGLVVDVRIRREQHVGLPAAEAGEALGLVRHGAQHQLIQVHGTVVVGVPIEDELAVLIHSSTVNGPAPTGGAGEAVVPLLLHRRGRTDPRQRRDGHRVGPPPVGLVEGDGEGVVIDDLDGGEGLATGAARASLAGSAIRSQLNLTASASNGVPSVKVTPSRRWTVQLTASVESMEVASRNSTAPVSAFSAARAS